MTLQSEERDAIIQYRIERALNTLIEAKDLAILNHWNLAVQRLYYATFYIQSALLLKDGHHTMTHVGVKSLVINYGKTGKISREDGTLLGRLFNMRQTGDYIDNFDWIKEDVEPLIEPTALLVKKIIGLIDK